MKTLHVVVEPYNVSWPDKFNEIKNEINSWLGSLSLAIEHVGSTSVKGLSAKPIIDIDVVIKDISFLPETIKRLEKNGYIYEGNLGIKDRYAFKYEGKEHLMTHHLYVCPQKSEELKKHIAFRNYLREHTEAVNEYSRIKEDAARLFPEDIDSYIEYKSEFISKIYAKLGF